MFARVDYLTGAWNRRAFHELVEIEISRLERQGYPFSILYLDVDNFKAVNDRFGHAAGDNVLKGVVAAMKRKRRPEDAVARLGGDEFAVLLSHTNDDEARNISLRIQDMLRDTVSARWPVAFSVGTITCHQPPASVYELIDKADQMMYKAKRENKKAIDRALHAEIFKAHTF
jgi:diguanylate cyclase (GGDEF)-like protein